MRDKFKLHCQHCNEKVVPHAILTGPHFKAMCTECNKFIKFLSKNEKEMYHELA